jgi:tetratricopeptide (TPR) repeat protein
MMRTLRWIALFLVLALCGWGQDRRTHIDVQKYAIDADVNPRTQSLAATVKIDFTPIDDTNEATFELNNALNVSKTVDSGGNTLPTSRNPQESSIKVSFASPLPKGKPVEISISYEGKLTGNEDSPVYGIKFAALHPDFGYLLYPARWFPISGYTVDRYSADLRITTPSEYRVVSSGDLKMDRATNDKSVYIFQYTQTSFPGSLAIVKGDPIKVSSQGISSQIYFRDAEKEAAQTYGDEAGKMMTYFTSEFGLAPQASLSIIETEAGAVNGYAAPGLVFLSPSSISKQVNVHVLSNQIARQWWGVLVSPTTRNHIWLVNGAARYSEFLYMEHTSGPGSIENDLRTTYIEALTVNDPPVLQSARLEDYSPEYWAVTAAKGAAVMNMLRGVVGDSNFQKSLRAFTDRFAYKSVNSEDFRKVLEQVSGQDLRYFFLQWLESSGSPEFKIEYTVFRTAQGFRITGKITQDLDTFRMPVDLRIETEGNPEDKKVEVTGTSSEFSIDTFGKPRKVTIDPQHRLLRVDNTTQVAVAIRRGEQFVQINDYSNALREYQRALDVAKNSSYAHYRIGELFFKQNNFQSSANEFRAAINGDLEPKWTEVWSHVYLGKIFDVSGQRDRALNEYKLAIRTRDNTGGAQEEAAKYSTKPYERATTESEARF